MNASQSSDTSREKKLKAIRDVFSFDIRLTTLIVTLGIASAAMQGVGLSFILPIVESPQLGASAGGTGGFLELFSSVYDFLEIPFKLEFLVLGAMLILSIRYTLTFLFAWLQQVLRSYYIRDLQERMFDTALAVQISYYDRLQSDQILNDIITETYYAGRVIQRITSFLETFCLTVVYLLIALFISPVVSIAAVCFLLLVGLSIRHGLESGYELGNRVAEGNAQRHEAAQTGVQDIRDVRLLGLEKEVRKRFEKGVDRYTGARILLRRNQNAIEFVYGIAIVTSVLALLYLGVSLLDLSIGMLTLYIIVMTQIGPNLSSLHRSYYQIQNDLPHLVWVQEFMTRVETEPDAPSTAEIPENISQVTVDNIKFAYDDDPVLTDLSLTVTEGETVAIVGRSGVGKSTLLSLLTRLYEPDSGEIRLDGIPIQDMDLETWRSQIAYVRQEPVLFNDTLWTNLTVGTSDTTNSEVKQACERAHVTEFLDDLPEGYDTFLGDEGARLSGGQKQRVALARMLLQNAPIVVLDEAMTELDPMLERSVLCEVTEDLSEAIVIAVTPRNPPQDCFDRVIHFEELSENPQKTEVTLGDSGTNYTLSEKFNKARFENHSMSEEPSASNEDSNKIDGELRRRTVLGLAAGGAITASGLAGVSGVATAEEGEKLGEIKFPSTGTSGVSNTFTGEFLVVVDGFTTNTIDIYEPSSEENATATHIATKVLPIQVSGVTWDHTRGRLWATEGTDGVFYLVDIGDQTESGEIDQSDVEQRFIVDQSGWPADGLAYDGNDDTIWWTYDGSDRVWKFTPDGNLVNDVVPELTPDGDEFIHMSGVAVGQERNGRPTLYLGDNAEEAGLDENSVVWVYADNGENITTYADVPFRVEDIACDPVTYSPQEAIVVKDAFDNKSTTFRVPEGTCPVAAGDPDPTVLEEALDEWEAANKEYVQAPFVGQGHFEAIAYHLYGETYADRIIEYWEYRAGIRSEEAVRESVRDLGDATLETVEDKADFEYGDEDAELLAEFYAEMFDEMASASDREELKTIGVSYYRGNYPGQDVFLRFDEGQTLVEGTDEADWDLATEVLNEYDDLTQDQIQRAATALSEKADRLRIKADDIIEQRERAAEKLPDTFDEDSGEVQGRILGDDVETDEVSPEGIITATGAALLVIGGVWASGYTLNKCASTAAAASWSEAVEFEKVDLPYSRTDNAVVSAFSTGVTLGQVIQLTGELAEEQLSPDSHIEPQGVFTSFLTATFLLGAKKGAIAAAKEVIDLYIQAGFATVTDSEIVDLQLDDIEDETQLDRLDGFWSFLSGVPWLGDFFTPDEVVNGEATGTVVINNTGSVRLHPEITLDYQLRHGNTKLGSGFEAEIVDPLEPIDPEDPPQEYEISYQVPTDEGYLDGEIEAELAAVPEDLGTSVGDLLPGICKLDLKPMMDRAVDRFSVAEDIQFETVDSGNISAGEVSSQSFQPDPETTDATIELDFDGYTTDLHLYDEAGNHVGYDYDSGTIENEIPGAVYSGRDTGEQNNEWISFPPSEQTYSVEIQSPSLTNSVEIQRQDQENPYRDEIEQVEKSSVSPTDALSADYRVESRERPELDPKLSLTPTNVVLTAPVETSSVTGSIVVEEVYGDQPAQGVSLSTTSLTQENGDDSISADNVTFTLDDVTIENSSPSEITVDLPENLQPGTYSGALTVESTNAASVTRDFQIILEDSPSVTDYADPETGIVETEGLRDAIDDWRAGDIDTDLLRDVIDAWRSGDPVE